MYVFYPKEYHKSLQQTVEKKNIAEKVCWDLVTKEKCGLVVLKER
jgi:hypothetical protein